MSFDRRQRMLGTLNLANMAGLEIGALNSPLVRKSEGSVRYVDYAPTEVVKADLISRGINRHADMVNIDIVWGERPLAEVTGSRVDYVVASHVIEHVPDLIGWLLELRNVLKEGGTLGLAVPDRRFTFDIRRNDSTPAEMVEAYLLGYRQPSFRQVFDAAAFSKNSEERSAWSCSVRRGSLPQEVLTRLPQAYGLVQDLARNPRYNDAHCWVFTPESFLDTAEALLTMQLFPFIIADFYPTEEGTNEFQVRLLAASPNQTSQIQASIEQGRLRVSQAATPKTHRFRRLLTKLLHPSQLKAALTRQAQRLIRA